MEIPFSREEIGGAVVLIVYFTVVLYRIWELATKILEKLEQDEKK